jgi:hypothetical protein
MDLVQKTYTEVSKLFDREFLMGGVNTLNLNRFYKSGLVDYGDNTAILYGAELESEPMFNSEMIQEAIEHSIACKTNVSLEDVNNIAESERDKFLIKEFPYLKLDSGVTLEKYLASLSKKDRYEFNKLNKELAGYSVTISENLPDSSIDKDNAVAIIKDKYPIDDSLTQEYAVAQFLYATIKENYDNGFWIIIYKDEVPVNYQYFSLRDNELYYLAQAGYYPKLGLVALVKHLLESNSNKCYNVNLGTSTLSSESMLYKRFVCNSTYTTGYAFIKYDDTVVYPPYYDVRKSLWIY